MKPEVEESACNVWISVRGAPECSTTKRSAREFHGCGDRAGERYLERGIGTRATDPMNPLDPRWCARIRMVTPAREVDRVDFDPAYDPAGVIECEICGNEMRYTAACKIMCGTCGYKRDCSDP
jgi:hypothetical protein